MPRNRSSANIWASTIVLFSFLVLVGHIVINFWERYTVHNQLEIMKRSLSYLKETVVDIEETYDNLQTEITELSKKLETKVDAKQDFNVSDTSLAYCDKDFDFCNREMLAAALRKRPKTKIMYPKNAVTITRFPLPGPGTSGTNICKCDKNNKHLYKINDNCSVFEVESKF